MTDKIEIIADSLDFIFKTSRLLGFFRHLFALFSKNFPTMPN